MNKLVLLNEVRKGKTNNKNKLLEFNEVKSVQEDSNKSYITFKEKFDCFQNKECFIDLNGKKIRQTKCEKKLNRIMERIFSFGNKAPLIEFINSVYNDELSINTRIEYIKNKDTIKNNNIINFKNHIYNVRILAEDDYRKFGYGIQFETTDDQNIAIIITKIDFSNQFRNIISLNKKKKQYENKDTVNSEKDLKNGYNKCLIMLNSNMEVPDIYEFKLDFDGENIEYKIDVMKSWKYDFNQLFENNMYLLFPLKALDLRKRLSTIGQDILLKELIKDEIVRFFKDMNKYLMKIKDKNLITDKDINEFNLIAIDLLNYFIKEKNNIYIDIKRDLEVTLKYIVV